MAQTQNNDKPASKLAGLFRNQLFIPLAALLLLRR